MNSTPRDFATSRSRLQSAKYDILPKTSIFIFLAIRNELLPNYTKQLVQQNQLIRETENNQKARLWNTL